MRRGGIGRPLDLRLEEADAIVELHLHRESLVRSSVSRSNKRRVMAADHGDITVFSFAEFDISVAGLCVLRSI